MLYNKQKCEYMIGSLRVKHRISCGTVSNWLYYQISYKPEAVHTRGLRPMWYTSPGMTQYLSDGKRTHYTTMVCESPPGTARTIRNGTSIRGPSG